MIPYKILPMFHLGFLRFNIYGIMFALGTLTAILIAAKEAEKRNIPKDGIYDLSLYLIPGMLKQGYFTFFFTGQINFKEGI